MRPPILAILPMLLASSYLPAAAEAPVETFSDSSSVLVVEVPVNVIAGGKAVEGLESDDFRVFDGDRERPLVGFDTIRLETRGLAADALLAGAEGRRVPSPARRRFLLFFDLAFTPRFEIAKSLGSAGNLLAGLDPSDLVAVGVYTRRRGAELLVNFTPDRRQVQAMLDGIQQVLDGKVFAKSVGDRDPLRLMVDRDLDLTLELDKNAIDPGADFGDAGDLRSRSRGGGSSGGEYSIATVTEVGEERRMSRLISYFRDFSRELSAFGQALAGLEGRRFLIFFSHGLPEGVFLNASGLGGTPAIGYLSDLIKGLRRGGWEVHSVDPRAIAVDSAAVDVLVNVAVDTGGTVYRNFGDLRVAMASMLEQTALTYVLAFQVEGLRQDGSFHPIRVELKEKIPGARLRHRQGFLAPKPDGSALQKAVSYADKIFSDAEGGELQLRSLTMPLPAEKGKTRMALLLEVPGEQLLQGFAGGELEIEAYAYAIGRKGEVADFKARVLRLKGNALRKLEKAPLALTTDLALEPGSYRLRVLLRQTQSGQEVLASLPFEVPRLGAGRPQLAALMRMAPPAGALLLGSEGQANPFVYGEGGLFLPDLAPHLFGQPADLAVFGFGLRDGDVAFSLELRNQDGELVRGKLKLQGGDPTRKDGLDRLYFQLDPKGLSAGTYKVEAKLLGKAGRILSERNLSVEIGAGAT